MSETLDPDPNATAAGLVIGLYRPRYESLSVPHAVYMSTFRSGQGYPRAVSATFRCPSPQRPRFSTPHIISHYKREEESAAVDFFGGAT